MINREQIESILKINGVKPSSADEEIRSVLMSARYNKDEVDTALMVLREDTKTSKTRVDGLHKIFRSSQALQPNEIAQLLGIDVDANNTISVKSKSRDLSTLQQFIVWFLSIVLAVGGIMFYMYHSEVGFFHPSAALSFK